MIDEHVLQQLLGELADEIEVPADGAKLVVQELTLSTPARRPSPGATRMLLIAAAVAVVIAVGLGINSATNNGAARISIKALTRDGGAKPAAVPTTVPSSNGAVGNPGPQAAQGPTGAMGGTGLVGGVGPIGPVGNKGPKGAAGPTGAPGASPQGLAGDEGLQGPVGATDSALIIKNGTLDLQVPHARLRPAVARVSNTAVGVGGYIANSQTSYGGADATAQITIRVPVNNFEAAIRQLTALPGITVLRESATGADVTSQYTNFQAQLTAATAERDSLLGVLGAANNVGDILSVSDRIRGVQEQIDAIQGQLNVISHKTSYSSIAVTLSEKPLPVPKAAVVKVASPPTGLDKAWIDARQGFSNSIEWMLARSGGALIVLLAALALIFGLRYLYPVVRRALL